MTSVGVSWIGISPISHSVALALPGSTPLAAQGDEKYITLDVREKDLREVLRAISRYSQNLATRSITQNDATPPTP